MKFEHILQVYWSKGFFYGGKLFYIKKLEYNLFLSNALYGLNRKFINLMRKRLELTTYSKHYTTRYYILDYSVLYNKPFIKTINIILSQISNVNLSIYELKKVNVLRLYLIKSYRGYCHAIGKPVKGQRTWSNGWNSYKCNNLLRNFINKTKRISLLNNTKITPVFSRSIKKKYSLKKSTKTSKNINSYSKSTSLNKLWF